MKKIFFGEITVTEKLYIQSADYGFLLFTGLDMNASIESVVHPDYLPLLLNVKTRLEDGAFSVIVKIMGKDGVYYPFIAELSSLKDSQNDRIFIRMRLSDLNCLLENERILKETKKLAAAYFDILGEVLLEYDRKHDMLEVYYVNNSRKHYLAIGNHNECISNIRSHVFPEYLDEFDELGKNIASSNKGFRSKLRFDGIDKLKGSLCVVECKPVGDKVVGCIKVENVDGLKDVNIDFINDKDAFLDMLNKRAVVEQAQRLMARKIKHNYFILLDLDNFKNVNDTYGHITGDEVLTTFTRIINDNVAGRGVVGRMGGDEILIVTETISSQTELRNMLRSIRTTVEWTFKNDPRDINVTCSMGVCSYADYGGDFQTVYSICDKMLYLAKEKGKNRYIIYTPELHDSYVKSNADCSESTSAKDLTNDKVGIMQRLVDEYLIERSYNNEKMFSEIGEAFNLCEILMIYENFTVAFQWTPKGVFSDIDKISHFKPSNDFAALFNKDNLLVLDGLYKLEGNCPGVEKCLRKKDVNAAIFYRIDRCGKFSGYVMFAKSASRRQGWSEYEIMALSTAAKVFDVSMHD